MRHRARAARSVCVALVLWATGAHAQEPRQDAPPGRLPRTLNFEAMAQWMQGMYTEAEFRALTPDQIRLEPRQCNCYDRPTPHYPYLVVILITPKGDLVLRPDQSELHVSFTQLARRNGDLYCPVEAGGECFGSFADVCDFTDFRFGAVLQPYFPTCKSESD